MKKIFLSAALFTGIAVISSCSNSKPVTDASINKQILFNNEWKLIELSGGKKIKVDTKAMISFTDGQPGKITGTTGCNRLSGTFEIAADTPYTIHFSPIATTRMACINEEDNLIDVQLPGLFSGITRWYIEEGNLLVLYSKSTKMATFVRKNADSTERPALNGTWELNYITGPKIAFDGLYPNKKPTIIFNLPKEEASGNGSCNGYSVKVKVEGNKINFGDALSTMMACGGNGEPLYFKTLKTVTSYSINNNELTLLKDDVAAMRFTKK